MISACAYCLRELCWVVLHVPCNVKIISSLLFEVLGLSFLVPTNWKGRMDNAPLGLLQNGGYNILEYIYLLFLRWRVSILISRAFLYFPSRSCLSRASVSATDLASLSWDTRSFFTFSRIERELSSSPTARRKSTFSDAIFLQIA